MEGEVSAAVLELAPAESRSDLRAGIRAMAPLTVAYLPFALVVGAAVASSANPLAAWLATWTIYGGAAHLAVLGVLAQGSGWAAAAAVGLLVNARLTAYATAMAPQWRSAPRRQRAMAALMLTDAPWALARDHQTGQRQFYLGAAGTLFVGWPAMVTVGVLVGQRVTAYPVTTLLPALALGAIVMPQLRQRPAAAAAAAATVAAVATIHLSAGLSLGSAAMSGSVAALLVERAR
jgi:predicted branched-subunit amino acid permease